jgi:hypothetical protein
MEYVPGADGVGYVGVLETVDVERTGWEEYMPVEVILLPGMLMLDTVYGTLDPDCDVSLDVSAGAEGTGVDGLVLRKKQS